MPRRLRVGFPREYRTLADRGIFALAGINAGLQYSGGALYDLYGTDSAGRGTIPFAVNWPAAPITSGADLTVTNNTELTTAQNTPGKRIVVAAGSYNALTLSRSDQDWVVSNGATFAGLGGSGFSRVKIEGGNIVTTADATTHTFSDLLLRNVNVECDDFIFGLTSTTLFQRLALVHCTVYAARTGFYTPGEEAGTSKATDIILAANYISGGMGATSGAEPAIRVQATERTIIVDNRARCGFDGQGIKHTYRSHYGNQEYWMRRNMTEYGDGVYWQARANNSAVPAESKMGRHWCYDFLMHSTNLSAYAFRGTGGGSIAADWLQPIVVDGNRGFTDVSANDNWIWQGQAGDTIGSNTTAPYQAPPALGAWLAADGLPPGADH